MKICLLLGAMVVSLTLGLVGCSATSSSDTVIEYRRSGGFAGLDDHLIIASDGEATLIRGSERQSFTLDRDAMDKLRTLFEDAAFSDLRRSYAPSREGADLFEYTITYQGRTVRAMDGAVPPALQPVLGALNGIVEGRGIP